MISLQLQPKFESSKRVRASNRCISERAISTLISLLCLASISVSSVQAAGNSAPAAGVSAKDVAKGDEIFKRACDFYKNQKSFSFSLAAGMNENGVADPEKKSTFDMSFTRPNKCAIELVSGSLGCSAYSDGKTMYVYSKQGNQFVSLPAPDKIALIMQSREYLSLDRGLTLLSLIHTLVSPDPYENMMLKEPVKVSYVDTAKIDGVECDHLKFTKEVNWDVWVRKDGDPWIEQVSVDISGLRAKADPNTKTLSLLSNYSKQSSAPVPDTKFAWTPPKGAEQLKPPTPGQGGSDVHPLTGKEAPNFTVDTLDGKKFELAKNKGQVVVLDFWATWCPPCRKGLPIVTEVTKSFQDKGVVFLAVNLREDPKKIKEFLDHEKISPNVGLDSDAAVGLLYKAQGIPQTVIIDKTGKIAKIDVGLSPDLKEDLTKTISGLLSGSAQ